MRVRARNHHWNLNLSTLHTSIQSKVLLAGLLLLGVMSRSTAQTITVSAANSNAQVQDYVENVLLGECVTVSNISFTGSLVSGQGAIGQFGNGAAIGIPDGIILSSGQRDMR